MSSVADERSNKRAAASKAEGKIKETLEELSGWSASEASSASSDVCRRLSDFDDLDGHSNKKSRTEDSEEDTKSSSEEQESVAPKDPNASEEASSTEAKEEKDHDTATTKDFSSSVASSSSSESSTESPVKTEREIRAEARNQNSTGPMVLSRRLSWQLQREPSPAYSPITAKSLTFTPSVVNVKTSRAH